MTNQKGKNTRERSEFLYNLTKEIAIRENINPEYPPTDNRIYIVELSIRGNCHLETARRLWARYIKYQKPPNLNWGGARINSGRKRRI